MSDDVRYQVHLRRLNQIKQRENHYPVFKFNPKGKKSPSPRKMKIDQLIYEIKSNQNNITLVKKDLGKKKPVNYDTDRYIYDREVENIQKTLINQLINNNKNLKSQLKDLQYYNNHFKKKK